MNLTTAYQVNIAGEHIPLIIRRNKRARRMTLRVQPATGDVILSLPKRTSIKSALTFVQEKEAWIGRQLKTLPPHIPFADGTIIPLLGIPHRIRHAPDQRQVVLQQDENLLVGGKNEFLARRLGDWLKKTARQEFSLRAHNKAEILGVHLRSVRVRDMKSRWGSCSEENRISLCWRLIFAPEEVADYVIAHEVAHLREMNHSKKFWEITASLCADMESAKTWLRCQGSVLYRYGNTHG